MPLVAAGEGCAAGANTRISTSSSISWTGRRTSTRTSKTHNYLEPIVDQQRSGEGFVDKWIVYGLIDGKQLFSAKELTLEPGAKCTLKDPGASGWITVQGKGRIGASSPLQTPAMIRFGEHTEDEVFISHEAAANGVEIENTGAEPLVGLRYFGPAVHANLPSIGDYRNG